MGCRGDWILRSNTNGDKQEFGIGKAGKNWVDENRTKFLKKTGLKLLKTLKDMLIKLMEKAVWDEVSCAKIQTDRRGELMEVPDNAENFCSILTILAFVLNIKAMVKETIKAVQSKKQIAESFKRAGFRKRPRDENKYQICSTPKKTKHVQKHAKK
ncbi:2026_t:CDS:2 [Funneliformis caledonium]|uniref:2026_t:CDS:1 n=1 Tax=Funneliformis caledonium TaxID=1117310 RepID=A0A9N9CK45_9GLOM|nr:2026_t:CDS:2 [Funneliformis caledonium]